MRSGGSSDSGNVRGPELLVRNPGVVFVRAELRWRARRGPTSVPSAVIRRLPRGRRSRCRLVRWTWTRWPQPGGENYTPARERARIAHRASCSACTTTRTRPRRPRSTTTTTSHAAPSPASRRSPSAGRSSPRQGPGCNQVPSIKTGTYLLIVIFRSASPPPRSLRRHARINRPE